jgi:4a-hydroxytetrahydrobiopterin dehydratase
MDKGLKTPPGWREVDGRLVKVFSFVSYADGVAFAMRVALDAEKHDHHPDELAILWKKVRVAYVTHSAGGITEKDLEAAFRVEGYLAGPSPS